MDSFGHTLTDNSLGVDVKITGFLRRSWLILLFLGLLLWLGTTAQRGTSLKTDIRTAYDAGLFGGLDATETGGLTRLVERSLIAAGMEPDFRINEPVRSDRLDILTFAEALSDFPNLQNLRPGNAAYDPRLDIIFLDVQQIKSALSAADHDPFGDAGQMFLVMTILHELGHRKLDGGTFGKLLLFTQGGSASERRADAFAHQIMANWTAGDSHPFSDIWGNGTETAGVFALLSLATITSRAQTKSDFGSYYTSDSHAHLIDRLTHFLQSVLAVQESGNETSREVEFVESVVSGAGNSDNIFCELRSQSPIRNFAWSDDGLWVLSDNQVYFMPVSDIRHAAENTAYCFQNLQAKNDIAPPPKTVVAGTFDDQGPVNALTEDGRVWGFQNGTWVELLNSEAEFPYFPTTGPVANPTVHRLDASSATVWHDSAGRIIHMGPNGPIVFPVDAQIEAFGINAERSGTDWVLVSANPNGFFLAPSRISRGKPGGPASLLNVGCSVTCEIAEQRSFSTENLPAGMFNVIASPDGKHVYATTAHTSIGSVSTMDLWRLDSALPAALVAGSPLFQEQASRTELIFYERFYQSLFRWGLATPSGVYVNYVGGDPVLAIDVKTGAVRRPYLQSDLFAYHYEENLLALSDRKTANIENEAFSIMIIDPNIRSTKL